MYSITCLEPHYAQLTIAWLTVYPSLVNDVSRPGYLLIYVIYHPQGSLATEYNLLKYKFENHFLLPNTKKRNTFSELLYCNIALLNFHCI